MKESPLANYLKSVMKDLNYDSERSFATYLGVSRTTVSRIMKGKKADPDMLEQIARALHLPVEHLYRLGGYLPPQDLQTQVLREIEHLLKEMPEEEQKRILELVRVEYKHAKAHQPSKKQSPREEQKAG